MNVITIGGAILTGGQSSKVATSTTSAQSAALTVPTTWPAGVPYKVLVHVDALTFVRQGSNPTALSDGTDQALAANRPYWLEMTSGNKLAFIVPTGTGNAYITPGS